MKLTKEQERALAVIYDLADGVVGREIDVEAYERRCEELRVFEMSDEEFARYKRSVDERVQKLRN